MSELLPPISHEHVHTQLVRATLPQPLVTALRTLVDVADRRSTLRARVRVQVPKPLRRALNVAVVGVLLIVALESDSKAADSIGGLAVRAGDPVVEKPALIDLTGYVEPSEAPRIVPVHVNVPGQSCAPTPADNAPRAQQELSLGATPKGSFSGPIAWTPERAGATFLCAWLLDAYPARVLAATSVAITIREPRVALELKLRNGPRFRSGQEVQLGATVTAEVSRLLHIESSPASQGCGATLLANQETALWESDPVVGGPLPLRLASPVYAVGVYRVCGYLATGVFDPRPLLVEGPTFWVGTTGPSCTIGAAPRRVGGRVQVRCAQVEGQVTVVGSRGSRQYTRQLTLRGGRGSVRGRAIGLRRGKRLTVRVSQAGTPLGARILRGR